MAPSKTKTAPHKSNDHKRYLADNATGDAGFTIDLNGNEAEGKQLQTVSKSDDSDFEGFGSEDADKDGEEENEESDAESVEINIQEKKSERVIPPKDTEEEELERLIFGDSAGFKDGLENFSISRTAGMYGGASDEEQEEGSDLDNVADDNLFFFDTGPEAAPAGSVAVSKAEESEDEEDQPAWDDSDDERLVISLASVPQLRKLRETAEDDMVNGKEYARRLRKQYERLYPAPEWAAHAIGKAKKRRRTMDDDEESGEESGSDMDVDDDLSTQPLARLLKDADVLSRNTARGPAKRRKLQAGTIDIQRLKDVAKAGPVRSHWVLTAITILTMLFSLRSPRFPSILHTLSCSHLDPAPHSRSTTSTPTRRTPIHSSHPYTSSVLRSQRPPFTRHPRIRVSS
jgi:U3 small nucleolar RNA-associated protein 18